VLLIIIIPIQVNILGHLQHGYDPTKLRKAPNCCQFVTVHIQPLGVIDAPKKSKLIKKITILVHFSHKPLILYKRIKADFHCCGIF